MNHSIHSADRSTHLKIVVVALVAGIAVAAFGISARTGSDYSQTAQVVNRYYDNRNKNGRLTGGLFVCSGLEVTSIKPLINGARDGTRTRGLRRDRAAL